MLCSAQYFTRSSWRRSGCASTWFTAYEGDRVHTSALLPTQSKFKGGKWSTYRPDTRGVDDALDMGRGEVGNPDRLDLASVAELDHRLPGIDQARVGVEDDPVRLVRVQRLKVAPIRERNGPVNDCAGVYTLIKPDRTGEKRRAWHSR